MPPLALMNVLSGVKILEDVSFEATIDGHVKVLRGVMDEETYAFRNLPSFGYLSSLSRRILNGRFRRLIGEGLLIERFDTRYGVAFLRLSDKARSLPLSGLKAKKTRQTFINFRHKED